MSAYLIIQATVTDPKKFMQYTQVVPALVKKFGGEYIVMGGAPDVLEGDFHPASVVMSKWPNRAAAETFWHSAEYKQALPLRANTGDFNVTLVDGLEQCTTKGSHS